MSKEKSGPIISSGDKIIADAERFATEKMRSFDAGHNWWHIDRVRRLSKYINQCEELADPLTIELAALFHDIGDHKFSDASSDPVKEIELFMKKHGLPKNITDTVIDVNRRISFSKGDDQALKSGTLMIVQDADRIDAIGAIGIARAFTYGAHKGNEIYIPAGKESGFENPAPAPGTTIGHFYDKLLRLQGLMNTETGRSIAKERHIYMEGFLSQFYREFYTLLPLKVQGDKKDL